VAIGWEPATNTATLRPEGLLAPGTVYTVAVGAVADYAGNPVAESGAWRFTVAPATEHEVTLTATPMTLAYGDTMRLSGSVDVPLAAELVLERSVAGGAWAPVATLVPSASGEFVHSLVASSTARFRARVSGSNTEAGASGPVRVLVRRGVAIAGQTTAPRTGTAGQSRSITVSLSPNRPDLVVTLSISRYDPLRKAWLPFAVLRRTSVSGRTVFSWRPSAAGSYYVRASTPSSPLFANGISAIQRWNIR
jgi:hypothetical protein